MFSDFREDPAPTPGHITFEYEAIYLTLYSGSSKNTTRISNLGGCDSPVVSPDGTRVAYIRTTLDWASSYIVIREINSDQQKEIKGNFYASRIDGLSWSPDGKKLALIDNSLNRIDILDVSSETISHVISERAEFVSFSPDGTKIAYMVRKNSDTNDADGWLLIIYDLGSQNFVTVTERYDMRGLIGPFYWTSLGDYLLFRSFSIDKGGNRGPEELWRVQANGENPERTEESWEILDQSFYPWFRVISENNFFFYD